MTSASPQPRLAIVDNDSGFVRVLANRLESAGWQFRVQTSAIPPEELVDLRLTALLLDPGCLGAFGWDYLARVCQALPGLGVLVCTERSTVAQRVRGLNLGADDWVTKPCHPEEVVARLSAISRRRRSHAPVEAGPLMVGDLELRPDQFQAFAGGRSAELTRREFEVLHLLAEARGRVLQREDIYQRVWGYAMVRGDRSVDVFIRKLRSKIESVSPQWRYIHTHFGVGYRFEAEPAAVDPEAEGNELEAVSRRARHEAAADGSSPPGDRAGPPPSDAYELAATEA
jgi:DNA-binding response OmpR family regulator